MMPSTAWPVLQTRWQMSLQVGPCCCSSFALGRLPLHCLPEHVQPCCTQHCMQAGVSQAVCSTACANRSRSCHMLHLHAMIGAPSKTRRAVKQPYFILSASGQVQLQVAALLCVAPDTMFCQLHANQASLPCRTLVPAGWCRGRGLLAMPSMPPCGATR